MGPMCSIILYIFSLRMRQTPKAHSIQMINNASIERSINLFFIPTETLHFRHLHHLSFYLLSYRVCFLHLRWVTLDDSYSSTIEFLCYEQPCFLLRFFFSHLNQLNSRSRGKQGKNGLVRVCIYNGQEKEATSIEGLYSRQGVKRERERERERYSLLIRTRHGLGYSCGRLCIDDAQNRAQTLRGTCPRYEWWMTAVCIGKQSRGNAVIATGSNSISWNSERMCQARAPVRW